MPCDSTYFINFNIDLGDWSLLDKALKTVEGLSDLSIDVKNKFASFFYNGTRATIQNGKVTVISGNEQLVPKINVAYGRQVVQAAKQRHNAELRQVAPNKFKLKLRS